MPMIVTVTVISGSQQQHQQWPIFGPPLFGLRN
jgi:hypothetical protein